MINRRIFTTQESRREKVLGYLLAIAIGAGTALLIWRGL